jgi:hypothetical protein
MTLLPTKKADGIPSAFYMKVDLVSFRLLILEREFTETTASEVVTRPIGVA